MSATTVKAYLSSEVPQELPASLEWMPAGEHEINATKGGRPVVARVTATLEDAALLDAQLQEALASAAAGKASRPYIDFNHDGKEAAAIPVKFFWENGIRLAVEWTKAGADAITGRTFSYFSPEFILGEDGHPKAIPSIGTIGALVNTPAFQTIERLAAAHNQEAQDMKDIAKALGLAEDATLEQITAALAGLQAKASEVDTVRASLADAEKKRDEYKATIEAEHKAKIDAEIDGYISAKRIAPDAKAFWQAAFEKNADEARKAIPAASVPGVAPVKADGVVNDPDKLKGEALLAHYKSLSGDVRAAFYAKHSDEIWSAYSQP